VLVVHLLTLVSAIVLQILDSPWGKVRRGCPRLDKSLHVTWEKVLAVYWIIHGVAVSLCVRKGREARADDFSCVDANGTVALILEPWQTLGSGSLGTLLCLLIVIFVFIELG
jgi:hypothetical protein